MVADTQQIDQILDKYNCEPGMLIQILQDVQAVYNWLPKEAMARVCERLDIPISRAYRIATFYTIFSLEPRGRHIINVCLGTACHVRGAQRIFDKVQDVTCLKAGHTTEDLKFTMERVNCLGCCALGPVITVDGEAHGKLTVKDIEGILSSYE